MFWLIGQLGGPVILPESGEGLVGVAGKLVAAVLETAGLYAQSEVLESFSPVLGEIGALAYVIAIIGAVMSVALFGNYKRGVYLLMAPALFYFMLNSRVEARGTAWHFGEMTMEDDPSRLVQLLDWPVTSRDRYLDAPPQVSFFFATYDNVLSSIVQQLVAVLIDTENRQHLVYAARDRMMLRLLSAKGVEPEYLRLLSQGLMGLCGKQTLLFHQLRQPAETPEQAQIWNERDAIRDQLITERVDLDPTLVTWLQTVVWEWHQTKMTDPQYTAELNAYFLSGTRLENLLAEVPAQQVTCQDIWRYTTLASIMIAEQYISSDTSENKNGEIPWSHVREGVAQAIVNDPEAIISSKPAEVVAAYILRNSMADAVYSPTARELQTQDSFDPALYKNTFTGLALHNRESQRWKLVYFAGSISYIQGILLFLLALAFPFFTLFLLLPGKVRNFGIWMALWLWVKSWDVGFAVVTSLQDIFFQFMNSDDRLRVKMEDLDWDNPELIFDIMLQHDPTATLSTYYHLIAAFTIMIPFLTAHLCLGATDVFEAVRGSVTTPAERFSARKLRASVRMSATPIQQNMAQQIADNVIPEVVEALDNPGKDITGRDRNWVSDMAVGRFANIRKNEAFMRTMMSESMIQNRNALALFTGRDMSYTHGLGQSGLEAHVARMNEAHYGKNMFQAAKVPIPGFYDTRLTNRGAGNSLGGGPAAPSSSDYDNNTAPKD